MPKSRFFVVLFLLAGVCLFGTSFRTESKLKTDTPWTANDDSFTVHGGTILSFVANDDFAGYNPYAVIVDAPSHGDISGGSLYVPDYGYTGSDTFTYYLCLSECSATATVTLSIVNSPPNMTGDNYLVPPNGSLCINLTKYTTDPEEDSFYDVEFIDFPDHGWLTGGSCGKTYHADNSYFGVDSFTYKLCDSLGACTGPVTTNISVDYYYGSGTCPAPPINAPQHPVAPENIAKPINVTSGNMWLTELDYSLPGLGANIEVRRYYNTWAQFPGLFGKGWTTQYDESIVAGGSSYDGKFLRLTLPDATRIQFGRASTSDPFKPLIAGLRGQIVLNGDGTYTLTFKDGRIHQFDSSGKLLWQKDNNGNQTTLTYTSGVLSSVTDPFSRTLTFTTNGSGNVTAIADSTGTIAEYEYHSGTTRLKKVTYQDGSEFNFEYQIIGSNGFLSSVTDAYDNVLEAHTYNTGSGGALTSEVAGGEEEYTIDYASNGQTIVTDGLGHETTYYFDAGRGVVTSVVGACGCGSGGSETTTFTYDERLNLVKKVDALSNETTYTYDIDGNLTSITDPIGTQTFTYNSFGEVLTHTDRMSGVTTNTYDANGNLLTTTDPLSNVTTFDYTTIGLLESVEDARANTTGFTYDSAGRLITVTDANNKETDFTYNARAQVLTVTNALNQTTEFEYDDNRRLEKIIYPDTNDVIIEYDVAGRRTSVTDELGHETTYAYDSAYRLTGITDALSHTTSFGYDTMSNLTSQTDALGNVTNFEYDDFDRLKKVKYPMPSPSATPRLEETFTYDKLGNIKTKVDTGGRTTSYDYDAASRLTKITDALSNETQFTYNARSQMTKVKDDLNQEYTFTYDALGRVLTQTRNSQTMTFTYDAVGNRITREDDIGNDTTYTYDDLNRLTAIAYSGASGENASYTYDDLSRLLTAVNAAGTVSLTYDNRGRLKTTEDVFSHNIEYDYDAVGNRTALELNSAAHASYEYDNANRLTTLTDEASNDFTFAHDNANRLISKAMPNSITSTFEYDGMSRLTRLKHQNTGSTLVDNQFSYNNANQISQITELAKTRNFTYDNTNRLTAMSDGTNSESYTFDAVGNRTASHLSASYTTGSFNRLTATTSASMTYNANGNMTGKTVGSTAWTYSWDRENRMVSASDGTVTVAYDYDALGRRVKRTQGSNVKKFTYDNLDVILDDDNGTITKYQNGLGIDSKLKLTSGGVSKYFLQDQLGSTVGLANSSGSVIEANDYDSFGNPTNASFSSRYQFTGREFDPVTGLQFSRARWYDPNLGRFISEDPIGFEAGDVNLYGYVMNNAVNRSDPTGLIDPIVNQDPKIYASRGSLFNPANPNIIDNLFGDGGVFTAQTGSEFISAFERSKRKCKTTWFQRWWNDVKTTNEALPGMGAPSIIPGVGIGILTSGATAKGYGTMTALQWAMNGFRGATLGGVAGAAAINFARVTVAFEAGVGIGAAINATFGFSDYCPCGG